MVKLMVKMKNAGVLFGLLKCTVEYEMKYDELMGESARNKYSTAFRTTFIIC